MGKIAGECIDETCRMVVSSLVTSLASDCETERFFHRGSVGQEELRKLNETKQSINKTPMAKLKAMHVEREILMDRYRRLNFDLVGHVGSGGPSSCYICRSRPAVTMESTFHAKPRKAGGADTKMAIAFAKPHGGKKTVIERTCRRIVNNIIGKIVRRDRKEKLAKQREDRRVARLCGTALSKIIREIEKKNLNESIALLRARAKVDAEIASRKLLQIEVGLI